MSKQKGAGFLYGLSTFLALFLVVTSIYDDREAWRIGLNCVLFVCCVAGLIVNKHKRRKDDE